MRLLRKAGFAIKILIIISIICESIESCLHLLLTNGVVRMAAMSIWIAGSTEGSLKPTDLPFLAVLNVGTAFLVYAGLTVFIDWYSFWKIYAC